jgi:hypothetical protein
MKRGRISTLHFLHLVQKVESGDTAPPRSGYVDVY